jgi:hypothetical protein
MGTIRWSGGMKLSMETNCGGCPESVALEPWSVRVLHERASAAQTALDRTDFALFEITFPRFCETLRLGAALVDLLLR